MEFKPFPKIEKFTNFKVAITQKIHGTNAQVFVYKNDAGELDLICGSRSRWITPYDDNYGFATFVHRNKQEFIDKLGPGQHFGEWAGPGINNGEGLTSKVFVLFDWWKFPPERSLPPGTTVVPLLYNGAMGLQTIDTVMDDLKTFGSKLSPGFMRPEGVVISIMGNRFKKVFKAEETAWTKSEPRKIKTPRIDYSEFLQPMRLEKLLSRDERYIKEYPESLKQICSDYVADLVSETSVEIEPRGMNSQLFPFIRNGVESYLERGVCEN